MNRGWTKVARGKHEMSDKTKFESIKVLNNALMERLGEVTGQLIRANEELESYRARDKSETLEPNLDALEPNIDLPPILEPTSDDAQKE
jgi:hypothetical protein